MASRLSAPAHAYRIVSPHHPPFDGGGAHRWGSRWCSPGRWVVHAAETYALAVLENLVHWQTNAVPPRLLYVEAHIPKEVDQERLDSRNLPAGWNDTDYIVSRRAGDEWYDRADTAVLWVPSVMSPYEHNVLFNQMHAEFARIRIAKPKPADLDPRLWQSIHETPVIPRAGPRYPAPRR